MIPAIDTPIVDVVDVDVADDNANSNATTAAEEEEYDPWLGDTDDDAPSSWDLVGDKLPSRSSSKENDEVQHVSTATERSARR